MPRLAQVGLAQRIKADQAFTKAQLLAASLLSLLSVARLPINISGDYYRPLAATGGDVALRHALDHVQRNFGCHSLASASGT